MYVCIYVSGVAKWGHWGGVGAAVLLYTYTLLLTFFLTLILTPSAHILSHPTPNQNNFSQIECKPFENLKEAKSCLEIGVTKCSQHMFKEKDESFKTNKQSKQPLTLSLSSDVSHARKSK